MCEPTKLFTPVRERVSLFDVGIEVWRVNYNECKGEDEFMPYILTVPVVIGVSGPQVMLTGSYTDL
jgi:hypothetical protein